MKKGKTLAGINTSRINSFLSGSPDIVSKLPLNGLERLEWDHIFDGIHTYLLLIGYENRVLSNPSVPTQPVNLEEE